MTHRHATLEDTVYLYFASNDTSGSGDDGATPVCAVRLSGATAGAAPVLQPTPVLLSHASYPAGAYEVAIPATSANGFSSGNTYAAFASLAVDSQNPTGFIGTITLSPIIANVVSKNSGVDFSTTEQSTLNARTLTSASYATSANQTTLLNRIGAFTGSGVNTILGFFQALMRSDSSTPSDLGGSYDDATDSLQAIRDRGDAAWTGSGGGLTAADVWSYGGGRTITGGTIDNNLDKTGYELSGSETSSLIAAVSAIWNSNSTTDPTGIPSATAPLSSKINALFAAAFFRKQANSTSGIETLYRSDNVTGMGTATFSDDGTTVTKGRMS